MMTTLEKAIFLQGTDIFHDAPSESLSAIGAISREVEPGDGEIIFREDEAADAFYAVVSGRVEQARRGKVVRIRGPGEVFGLWSVFDGELRSETVVATRDVRLLKVSYADFQDLVLESMNLGWEICRVLAREIEEEARKERF